ncbi:type II toxin-antitoxin system HicB family antitoxin [Methanospirillum stamsii]|uniref:Antitoxin HicB n=1 Tax=Methanospirillum stamsii TaxID=1277351 RepID=A0A2V2N4M3_9EURY|nr:type II toxin-antitoxin system HicB family antitoxin [Methanospirillum stamsii]PWR75044.1 antitoxin HicB [Methanospirillum stamsii]
MNQIQYRILLRREPEGGFTVTVPLLPGCVTWGDTLDEAIGNAKEAIELYLESLTAHGEEIPSERNVLEYLLTISENEQIATSHP